MFPVIRVEEPLSQETIDSLVPRPSPLDEEVLRVVRGIIAAVRDEGDTALLRFAREFDGCDLSTDGLRVSEAELRAAGERVSADYLCALMTARTRIESYHKNELTTSWQIEEDGMVAGELIRPVARAGIYAPGGQARYPSTILMAATAARVAGVPEIYVCTPPLPDGSLDPHVLAAAEIAGVTALFKVGGAGAIAALALGTKTIPRVDKIVGPGNIWVTAAKREVVGLVGIEGLAGPSEVVVLADRTAPADFVAADLLAQVEHGSGATAVLVTWDESIPAAVAAAMITQLERAPSYPGLSRQKVQAQVKALVTDGKEAAIAVTDLIAAEHVQVMTEDAMEVAKGITNAGAILVGPYTPAAFSDYAAGPNHVLPTGGSARFASPLGVNDFVRRTSILRVDAAGASELAPTVAAIAQVEGLQAHKAAALLRSEKRPLSATAHSDATPPMGM